MSDLDLRAVYRINPRVRFRRIFEEAVVIHQGNAQALVVSDTGAAFLELCDGHRTTAEIIARMAQDFEVEAEQLQRDVTDFVSELLDEGVLSETA